MHAMNLLIDTNVLIDYLGRKEPFFPSAQKLVIAGLFGDVKLWVPSQSIIDSFYVLKKYVESKRLQAAILKTLEVVTPLDLTSDMVFRAASLAWDDMEDCLIALAAEKVGAAYIITRDINGFSRSMVPALSPNDWIALMKSDYRLEYDEVDLVADEDLN